MRRLFFALSVLAMLTMFGTTGFAAELSLGLSDYWGNFTLNYQDYELTFEVDGIGLLGFNIEGRFYNNRLFMGAQYVAGKYHFEGAGTTGDEPPEELTATGDRNRKELDLWLGYAPSRHFSAFLGYKKLDFDFRDVYADWSVPEGKELEGEADAVMAGLVVGFDVAFGRRLITSIGLSYFPSLSGDVSWNGRKRDPGEDWETDTGDSTIDTQGLRFELNFTKPFTSINSALTLGYYLQVVADELDTINYRTDELFTGIMINFTYTFRFGQTSESEPEPEEAPLEDTTTDDLYSSVLRSF